jgi:hypothetical protein
MHRYSLDINELSRRIAPPPRTSQSSTVSLPIPPEILAQIFFHCIPCEQFPIPSHNEAPLLLTRISSYWRTLAINTPDLWSAFHINYKDPAEDIPATNLWLDRSTNRPLSLSLAIDFGERSQQAILDALCRHSNRWKHVRFDFRHLYCPPMYSLDIAQGSIPQLSTFEFHARDISSTNLFPIIHLLKTAPKLREVTWVDDLADTDMLLELPLNQLTRLSLAMDHGTLDYVQILSRCSNLQQIRITRPLLSSYQTYQSKLSPLFLDKLTSLTISYDLTAILDHLVLPALMHVRIFTANHGSDKRGQSSYPTTPHSYESLLHHSHYLHLQPRISHTGNRTEVWDPSPLISLIDRSTCDISTLSLCAPMMENALLLCLSKISAELVSLELEGVEVGDKVLSYLTRRHRRWRRLSVVDDGAQVRIEPKRGEDDNLENAEDVVYEDLLCPNLADLILHTQIISSPGVLANMVASRLRLGQDNSKTTSSNPDDYAAGNPTLKKLVMVEGHWDLDKVKEFSSLSQSRFPADGLKVCVIPRKATVKGRTRNYFFRRKLCSSR